MATIFDRFWGMFSTALGIDLGTANTLVYAQNEGIVLAEPSVVAIHKKTGTVLMNGEAVGNNAKDMIGKTHDNIEVIRPLKDGVVNDVEITEAMMSYFIHKGHTRRFIKPQLVVSVPIGINNVAKRAVFNAAERAGANRVWLIEQPFAAAIGAGMPVGEATGSMIVDIGGGTTDIAVTALAGIVESKTLDMAGDRMDEAIIEHLRNEHGVEIGHLMAERIKLEIGSACELEEERSLVVRGRHIETKLPAETSINSIEVRSALKPCLDTIVRGIPEVLEQTPPELSGDLVSQGVTLAGGGSQLDGLEHALQSRINLPVHTSEDPITAVVRGTGIIIEALGVFEEVLEDAAEAA